VVRRNNSNYCDVDGRVLFDPATNNRLDHQFLDFLHVLIKPSHVYGFSGVYTQQGKADVVEATGSFAFGKNGGVMRAEIFLTGDVCQGKEVGHT